MAEVCFPWRNVEESARRSPEHHGCSAALSAGTMRAPPAGFEPAHTAPERVAVYGPNQRKHAVAVLPGGGPGTNVAAWRSSRHAGQGDAGERRRSGEDRTGSEFVRQQAGAGDAPNPCD